MTDTIRNTIATFPFGSFSRKEFSCRPAQAGNDKQGFELYG